MKLPMIVSAVLLLMAAQIEKPAQMADVPRWSVYELTLTASDTQRDLYLERDLVGVFSGPTGQSIVVNGFWDGDRTFRLRFTPTAEGVWTYMTVSSDQAMDGQMGSIRCTAPQSGVHGFVRGQAGQTAQIAGWTFDDGAPASALAAQVVPLRGAIAGCGAAAAEACAAPDSMAQDHLSLAQLRRSDQMVQEAQAKGTVAEVQLFDAIDTASLDDLQAHRVIDYALARYGAYTNVAWCLHPAAAVTSASTAGPARPWTALRGVVRMDDPYFAESFGLRVVLSQCAANPTAGPGGTL
jgi:hypothetical protein